MRVREVTKEAHLQLVRTAKQQQPATMWIKGGRILDVYLRRWREANIVIAGERIAYVGEKEPLVDDQTEVIEAAGYHVVPGYIEPHAHPFQWYNPHTLSDYALRTGTTTVIADTLTLYRLLPFEQVSEIMQRLAAHPVKYFFWARLDPQNKSPQLRDLFRMERLQQMIDHPQVIQGGELTDWHGVLYEDEQLLYGLRHVRDVGKRMEGHHPGASDHTLNIAAAAGVTACHESITAAEVINRLQLGYYVALRHSSIRPDLPELIKGLIEQGITYSPRLMLTSDGSTPPMMRAGFTDSLIRLAIEAGLAPEDAYAMATLNPAAYYGLDAEIGGIAPGRLADILLLATPEDPTPEVVVADGRRWSERKQLLRPLPSLNWQEYSFPTPAAAEMPIVPELFSIRRSERAVPVINMRNAVITESEQTALTYDADGMLLLEDPELALLVLIDPIGKKVTQAVVRGYGREIEAIASTYTISSDWIVIGRHPQSMAAALRRVLEMGGGVAMVEQGETVYEMALPIGGLMTDAPMEEVIRKAESFVQLMKEKEHSHIDPIYSLLFFTATHLPFIRVTSDGVYDVKRGCILTSSVEVADLIG
ncbi:amidohydrolase family protein [Brevibacillus humidisoli]|uniref:adenine deaminase C-terminal domain-containing protein n=1 Tax=Brevibacillus humidisoli TaxID=2895522 RepID=UPI001E39BF21|nr:adenine deaminase C-terminal domain-containing protein [Brevibacillus humidisoli]UFJ41018.1 amidohydrolase family protein [Brevibacillus humidisoli]